MYISLNYISGKTFKTRMGELEGMLNPRGSICLKTCCLILPCTKLAIMTFQNFLFFVERAILFSEHEKSNLL